MLGERGRGGGLGPGTPGGSPWPAPSEEQCDAHAAAGWLRLCCSQQTPPSPFQVSLGGLPPDKASGQGLSTDTGVAQSKGHPPAPASAACVAPAGPLSWPWCRVRRWAG